MAAKGLDGKGVAIAVMDTGINLAHLRSKGLKPSLDASVAWSPVSGKPGKYPTDHGTMCAYDALIAAPKATLYDFPILLSQTPGGSAMDGFLSDALQAYGLLLALLQKPAANRPFSSLVISNSWGMYHPSWDFPKGHPGRYADNPTHPFNVIVATVARTGADVLFAAGNCGADCPDGRCEGVVKQTITGANAHPDVTTVAGTTVQGSESATHRKGRESRVWLTRSPILRPTLIFLAPRRLAPTRRTAGHPRPALSWREQSPPCGLRCRQPGWRRAICPANCGPTRARAARQAGTVTPGTGLSNRWQRRNASDLYEAKGKADQDVKRWYPSAGRPDDV